MSSGSGSVAIWASDSSRSLEPPSVLDPKFLKFEFIEVISAVELLSSSELSDSKELSSSILESDVYSAFETPENSVSFFAVSEVSVIASATSVKLNVFELSFDDLRWPNGSGIGVF